MPSKIIFKIFAISFDYDDLSNYKYLFIKCNFLKMKVSISKIINPTTCRVSWSSLIKNPRYQKYQKTLFNRTVHVDKNLNIQVGDLVLIAPCRPMSKLKNWEIKQKI